MPQYLFGRAHEFNFLVLVSCERDLSSPKGIGERLL